VLLLAWLFVHQSKASIFLKQLNQDQEKKNILIKKRNSPNKYESNYIFILFFCYFYVFLELAFIFFDMMMAIGLSQYNVALMHTVNHAFFV
jgi:hypothetical protein